MYYIIKTDTPVCASCHTEITKGGVIWSTDGKLAYHCFCYLDIVECGSCGYFEDRKKSALLPGFGYLCAVCYERGMVGCNSCDKFFAPEETVAQGPIVRHCRPCYGRKVIAIQKFIDRLHGPAYVLRKLEPKPLGPKTPSSGPDSSNWDNAQKLGAAAYGLIGPATCSIVKTLVKR